MKRPHAYIILFFVLGLCQGCTKPPNDNPPYPVPQDVMDFFVNFDPGTCWVYQDTMNPTIYDTVELMSKKTFCVTPDGDIPNNDGFQLYYKPGYAKDFTVFLQPYKNNSCNISICQGQNYGINQNSVEFAFDGNQWTQGFFRDSITVGNKTYHNALDIKGLIADYYEPQFVKNVGLVSYKSNPVIINGSNGTYSVYVLVNTFKK